MVPMFRFFIYLTAANSAFLPVRAVGTLGAGLFLPQHVQGCGFRVVSRRILTSHVDRLQMASSDRFSTELTHITTGVELITISCDFGYFLYGLPY